MDHAARRRRTVARRRQEAFTRWLDAPLAALGFIMLGLILVELTTTLPPVIAMWVTRAQLGIWAIFTLTFVVEFAIAPVKTAFLRKNWLAAIAAALPFVGFLRVFRALRVLRIARVTRGLGMVRVFAGVNRVVRVLRDVFAKGQLAYVAALVIVVVLAGAASAYYLERGDPNARIRTIGDALWWAAALSTTVNSSLEAVTFEGRAVALVMRLFGLAVSSYVTAAIAAYLIGDASRRNAVGSRDALPANSRET